MKGDDHHYHHGGKIVPAILRNLCLQWPLLPVRKSKRLYGSGGYKEQYGEANKLFERKRGKNLITALHMLS